MKVEELLKILALKCQHIICTDLSIVFEVDNVLHEVMYAHGCVYQEYTLDDTTLDEYMTLCRTHHVHYFHVQQTV